jgi:hypothetical protein
MKFLLDMSRISLDIWGLFATEGGDKEALFHQVASVQTMYTIEAIKQHQIFDIDITLLYFCCESRISCTGDLICLEESSSNLGRFCCPAVIPGDSIRLQE